MSSPDRSSLYEDTGHFGGPFFPSMARSTTQPAPGEATATGDAMEKANRDGNSGDPLPTYSTWVFRDGEFVPIQPRSPSPPPPPLSSARREFDERIRAAHEERAQNSAAEVPRLTRSTINVQLQWRIQKLQEEQSNQLWRKPYKLFAPWPLEMRMRCANYVDLLDEYYKHEETTRRMVEYQLAHYGDPENQWQINEEELEEIAHLTKLQKTLEEDKKADNDFKVLSKVLEDKEGEINQRTGSAPGHLVSDLPEHVMQLIERDPRLQKRLEDARATELANLVANARIQDTGPEVTEIGLGGRYAEARGGSDMSDYGETGHWGEQDDNKKNWQMSWW